MKKAKELWDELINQPTPDRQIPFHFYVTSLTPNRMSDQLELMMIFYVATLQVQPSSPSNMIHFWLG